MFIYSAKMDKKKLATILACLGVVAIVLILLFTRGCGDLDASGKLPDGEEVINTEAVLEISDKTTAKLLKKARIRSAEDAAEFLANLGWQVSPEPVEAKEVVIPAEFSDVYTKYNELQKTQGFDLSKCAGETAFRWTMRITNHPSGEEEVYATLLVINAKLVGGDVCAARLDGFMHGLAPSSYQNTAPSAADVNIPAETTAATGVTADMTTAPETTAAPEPMPGK